MSGPYSIRDAFEGWGTPLICQDPENCQEYHEEPEPGSDELHHYGCTCGWCQYMSYIVIKG